jgi:3-oxocholest-4-en-26-oate---CoA ligase
VSATTNLADLFEAVADACPDRTALVAGDVRRTYRQLDEQANRIGHVLVDAGVAPGDHVGIVAWNRAEWIESMLGAFKVRAVPINVNYRYVEDELRYVFDNADLVALLHDGESAERVRAVLPDVPRVRHTFCFDDPSFGDALAAVSPDRDFPPRSPDDRYVLYTGGTTGMPKGVVWRQEDIYVAAMGGGNYGGEPVLDPGALGRAAAEREPVVYLVTAPMMHGGGQWMSFIAFTTGGTVVLYTGHRFDPEEVWAAVEAERAVTLMVVGDAMARPLAEALAAEPDRWDTSSLAVIGSGGAILSKSVKEQLRAQLPGAMVMDSFGASETGANGTVMDLDGPAAGPKFVMAEHTTVLGDDLRPVAPGSAVVGRLARRGHIPLGYYKDEAKTAATFVVDPDGVRWVVPGDMAVVEDDGTISLLGRGSVCINTGGEKVFPEEVEAALKSHPDVFDAVVVGVPDERFTERVCAVVAPRPGADPALDDLAAHCRTQIAGYKVPRQLRVVDQVVRTPVGKPDYRWAKALAEEPVGT